MTLVGDLDYRARPASGGTIFAGVAASYRSKVDTYVGGSVLAMPNNGVNRWLQSIPFTIKGYALVDARMGYEFPGDRLTLTFWGKNIFNKYHVQNVISYNDIITQSVGQPASYGVSANVKW